MTRKSRVRVYVRHLKDCTRKKHGEQSFGCGCPLWLRWSAAGKQHRQSANTTSWGLADGEREKMQKALAAAPVAASSTKIPTVRDWLATFLVNKKAGNITPGVVRKFEHRMGVFADFLAARGKFYPAEIKREDTVDFRASWKYATTTKQQNQTMLKEFLTFIKCTDLLEDLKPIKTTTADKARVAPKPFNDAELAKLLEMIPATFSDPVKCQKLAALINVMVCTGLAIGDAARLERSNIVDGYLTVHRMKTGKLVAQRLDASLVAQLDAVENSNPRFYFTDGEAKGARVTRPYEIALNKLMKAANLYVKGNLAHRFRDTFVDWQVGNGASTAEIAALIADTEKTVAKHYMDLTSRRMADRLAQRPVRKVA